MTQRPDLPPGSALLDLVAVMDRLRSPGGCPWDARQTHESLVEYVLEETYETVEAIETGDRDGLREELGDLLLQVVFHARIAAEDPLQPWDIDDVAEGIVAKLVRRHPHVFDAEVAAQGTSVEQVEADWQARKTLEKGRTSVADGVPLALPALLLAHKLLGRAERGGVDVEPATPDARARAAAAVEGLGSDDELGDLLLALTAQARARDWDAEAALRAAVRRHISTLPPR